jgi:hypothetical protein
MNIFQKSRSKAFTYIARGKAGVKQKNKAYVYIYLSKAGVNEE